MRARLSHLILILAGLGLSACARMPPDHVALDIQARNNVHSTDVVAPVRQGEVYVFVPQTSTGGQGGLLGALVAAGIDSVRTSKAEDAVKPLRDAVVDFNFDDVLRQDLKASMSKVQWLNVTEVKVIKDVATASLDSAITDSKASAVLMVAADYHLSNDGSTFDIAIKANLFPNSLALTQPKTTDANAKPKSDVNNAIYRNAFTFEAKVPGATEDRDRNMNVWAANHGELLRAATTKGVAKLTELIAADIQEAPLVTTEQAKVEKVLGDGPDGVLTRHANGTLAFAAK
jgi:hypothetical protein